ncbi:MAG: AMP-binding protein, partial [Candidatus Poribacteria bacterium]|nr:AMP-binding protein [Candidatus Poribacteria bacterium]
MEGPPLTIREAIDALAEAHGDASYLVSAEGPLQISFADLREQSEQITRQLHGLGLSHGDRVACLLENGVYSASVMLSAMYGGLVAVPINPLTPQTVLIDVLNHSGAEVIYASAKTSGITNKVMDQLTRNPLVIVADETHGPEETPEAQEDVRLPILKSGDHALLIYSSGTIGRPKGVIHTHRSVLAFGTNGVMTHGLHASDRSLLVLPLHHINATCVTLLPTLLSGGTVVVARRFETARFWKLLSETQCTWSAIVPTIVAQLLDQDLGQEEIVQSLHHQIRFLRSSSAPLSRTLQREFQTRFRLPLLQAMGQSEAGNVFSNPLPPGENKIGSVGLMYGFEGRIVDDTGEEVPAGLAGDVWIRGPGLMEGYWNDEESNADVFDAAGWMRTGDIAYRDQDGYFFMIGRSKEIIIKAGVNIAPREIDEVLESHPDVLHAAAVGVEDHHLGEDVIGFAVLRSDANADEKTLLSYCGKHLGHLKTPRRIIFLDSLPQDASGKVQRHRLADQAQLIAAETSLPSILSTADDKDAMVKNRDSAGAIETMLVDIWKESLELTHIPHDENFFSLGGYSLLAIQSLAQLREKHSVMVLLSEFFSNATITCLAALIRQRMADELDEPRTNAKKTDRRTDKNPTLDTTVKKLGEKEVSSKSPSLTIPKRTPGSTYPVSRGQTRMFIFEQMSTEVEVLNLVEAMRLRGKLNAGALEQAFEALIERHENLRTTFDYSEGQYTAVVHQTWPMELKKMDLRDLTDADKHTRVDRILQDEPSRPYQLDKETGFRVTLIRLDSEEQILLLMFHHIICDSASVGVFWRELSTLYRDFCDSQIPRMPKVPLQFGDFASWDQQPLSRNDVENALSFWKEELRGAPEKLDLPADRPRPQIRSFRGATQRYIINSAISDVIRQGARRERTSLFNMFSAALSTLLYRYSGQDDILIGLPIAVRDRSELQSVIGFLLETHVMRSKLSGDMSFRELLASAGESGVAAYDNRYASFDQIVNELQTARSLSYAPIFQVMMNWREFSDTPQAIGLDGLIVESIVAQNGLSMFDLTLNITDTGDDIRIDIEYSTELFESERIVQMACHYQTLLEEAARNPETRLSNLPLLTGTERRKVLQEWNRTETVYPSGTLHGLVEQQVRQTPELPAVVFGGQHFSYRELNERANKL